MQSEGKQSVRVGGQFLSRTAIPVGISTMIDDAGNDQIQRALLLPSVKTMGRPSRLITTGASYRSGAMVKIFLETGTIKAKLTKEYARAGLYYDFEYEEISDHSAAADNRDLTSDDKSFDDDVWSSI